MAPEMLYWMIPTLCRGINLLFFLDRPTVISIAISDWLSAHPPNPWAESSSRILFVRLKKAWTSDGDSWAWSCLGAHCSPTDHRGLHPISPNLVEGLFYKNQWHRSIYQSPPLKMVQFPSNKYMTWQNEHFQARHIYLSQPWGSMFLVCCSHNHQYYVQQNVFKPECHCHPGQYISHHFKRYQIL